jgi:hypothetical protein
LALSIRGITSAFAWNADFVSPMVFADRLGTRHDPGEVIFGTYAPLTTLWSNLLVRELPGHRLLWKLGPLLVTLIGIAALGWAIRHVAGRWAAVVAMAVAFSSSSPVLSTLLAQANHGATYFVVCILAGFLVLVSLRPPTPAILAGGAVLGVVAGLNIASDPLLLLVGSAPFVGAAALVRVCRQPAEQNHALPIVVGVTGLSLATAMLASRLVKRAGYGVLGVASDGHPLAPASPSEMLANARRLAVNLQQVFNADLSGGFGPATPVRMTLAVLGFVGLCVPVVLLVRSLVAGRRPSSQLPGDSPALAILEVYWGLVVLALTAGLVVSRLAVGNAPRTLGYLTPLFLAIAVSVPIAARRSLHWRAVVGAGAGLFCLMSIVSLTQRQIPKTYDQFGFVRDGDQVLGLIDHLGLHRGYASYGAASPLTFRSGGRILVSPVIPCAPTPDSLTLCGFPANRVRAWYTPQPGPSFVIADPTLPWAVPVPPPAGLGVPSQVLTAGSQTVYVYPYDVASRFGPTN